MSVQTAFGSTEPTVPTRAEADDVAATLIARGQADGTIRDDVEVGHVVMIVCGLAAVIDNSAGDWRRYLLPASPAQASEGHHEGL
jgi:hypothetical protein